MASFNIITGNVVTNFLKMARTLSLSSFCLTDYDVPTIYTQSLLEYWAFGQHCLSKSMTLC